MFKKLIRVECKCGKRYGGGLLISFPDFDPGPPYDQVLKLTKKSLSEKGWTEIVNLREVLAGESITLICKCPECSLKPKEEKDKK